MKIRDLFGKGRPLFSFEFFPPKTEAGIANLEHAIAELEDLAPDFVSVTYGAGGSTRDRTVDLVTRIQRDHGFLAMAHLTGIASARAEVAALVARLVDAGIENLIPLRGDLPAGVDNFVPPADAFAHASDLVAFIRQRYGQRLCLAGAGYPEGHPQCRDLALDMQHFLTKVRAGVDFIITQLFFDNRVYFDFVARARAAGITVPIIPGIMPIASFSKLWRFADTCGAEIPRWMRKQFESFGDDPASIRAYGLDVVTALCERLIKAGAPGLHFYTLNQAGLTTEIVRRLGLSA